MAIAKQTSRRVLQWTALVAFACCARVSFAQSGEPAPVAESTVKAAFLYKFAGYVQWPASSSGAPTGPIRIGVAGANDFARELAQVTQSRTVSDRAIDVRRVTAGDALDDIDILFIGEQENDSLPALLAAARGRPILTVTERRGALADGSIINFVVDEQRVRFDVALYAAERSQLKLNSRLLAVARQVQRVPE